ncbi:MAG: helix-turn-helix transcriptional regulator [Defluviitaleaceae bacterium]|nr:helix-turn-helix transcriptional regulator [Defluviitaleaceae bacterium]
MKSELRRNGLLKLSVTEKIYALRKKNNINQEVLAEIMRVGRERISRIERGKEEYIQAQIDAAKKSFRIVGLPITEREIVVFLETLYHWRDLIGAKRLDEARVKYKELSNIGNLEPCDFHMVTLCKLIGIRFLIADNNYIVAEKELKNYEKHLEKMTNECKYHYYFNKGFLNARQGHPEKSLDFYLKAYELVENQKDLLPRPDGWLYYGIAWCYSYMEIPYHALTFWRKARQAHVEIKADNFTLYIDHSVAINYMRMNQLRDAESLLNKCMVTSESTKDNYYVGMTLYSFGFLHKQRENWNAAIEYFDKASKYLLNSSDNCYTSLYHKIYCVIHTRAFTEARQLLEYAKTTCVGNKLWTSYYEALEHYLKISKNMTSHDNGKIIEYIENIAIPYFIKQHDYFIAIDYYALLERHYEKINSRMRSLEMTKAIYGIYKRCLIDHGGRD